MGKKRTQATFGIILLIYLICLSELTKVFLVKLLYTSLWELEFFL
ncbi:hypothetical protein [Acidilutibacter cellobiosedens]|jgi:hypothetical protein|nr:hypothetical protein [Acidilutibacter cellobiosedens]